MLRDEAATAPMVLTAKLLPRPEKLRPPGMRRLTVARTLAFAHHLRDVLERGEVRYREDLARALGVTGSPITQLVNLTYLSPLVQEHVLSLDAVDGVEPMTLKRLLQAVRHVGWSGSCENSTSQLERSTSSPRPRGRNEAVPFALVETRSGRFHAQISRQKCSAA